MRAFAAERASALPPIPQEIITELSLVYTTANRWEIAASLNRISCRTGIPRQRLKRAMYLRGYRTHAESRPWSEAELAYLDDSLGAVSVAQIARRLKRSRAAVYSKAGMLERSTRLMEGYDLETLCRCFGLSFSRVKSWTRRGLLGKAHGQSRLGEQVRFSEASVFDFIRNYPHEYDLGRVDQLWFKSVLFGRLSGEGV